jgi:glycosyltransferase involved in cell wall biosynthesis
MVSPGNVVRHYRPSFSVIIPTFNRAGYIGLAVDSVLLQRFRAVEVIVVDDGSTDDTQTVVGAYGRPIRYIGRQKNRGVSAARNRGIRSARGEWIAFLDSDDEWLPDYLDKHADLLAKYPSVVGSVMNSVTEEQNGDIVDRFESWDLYPFLRDRADLLVQNPFGLVAEYSISTLQSCIFRRDVLMTTRLFDENITIAEDWDIVAQMALKGPFALCRDKLVRVIRRREETDFNLSAQFYRQAIRTRLSWARVFARFADDVTLSAGELKALRKTYAANQRALGNLLLDAGSPLDARRAYRQAWGLDHSAQSCYRLILSFLPEPLRRSFPGKKCAAN